MRGLRARGVAPSQIADEATMAMLARLVVSDVGETDEAARLALRDAYAAAPDLVGFVGSAQRGRRL